MLTLLLLCAEMGVEHIARYLDVDYRLDQSDPKRLVIAEGFGEGIDELKLFCKGADFILFQVSENLVVKRADSTHGYADFVVPAFLQRKQLAQEASLNNLTLRT